VTRFRAARAVVVAVAAVLSLAPPALADTCCANVAVGLEPTAALPGDTVRLIGIRCLDADNTGPLPLKLGAFWLSAGSRAAEAQPDTAPGPGLPADLPPTGAWLAFTSLPDATATSGNATITVPDLPNGTYQLWWWCDDGSGPGGGIHYSTGPRLRVGPASPDTATAGPATTGSPDPRGALLLVLGGTVVALALRRRPLRGREP
jgi:hypothetical protein